MLENLKIEIFLVSSQSPTTSNIIILSYTNNISSINTTGQGNDIACYYNSLKNSVNNIKKNFTFYLNILNISHFNKLLIHLFNTGFAAIATTRNSSILSVSTNTVGADGTWETG